MAYKIVGVDENSLFPPRVETRLDNKFVSHTELTPTTEALSALTTRVNGNDDKIEGLESADVALLETINSRVIWGNYADRPAAISTEPGTQFAAIDVPEVYLNTGDVWRPIGNGGNELAYAEHLPMQSNSNTTFVKIEGYAATFIAGERPVQISGMFRVAIDASANSGIVQLRVNGAIRARIEVVLSSGSSWETQTFERVLHDLTPGQSYTAEMWFARGSGSVIRIAGDSENPNTMEVKTV